MQFFFLRGYLRHEDLEERAGNCPCLSQVGPDPVDVLHVVVALLQGGDFTGDRSWSQWVGRLGATAATSLQTKVPINNIKIVKQGGLTLV